MLGPPVDLRGDVGDGGENPAFVLSVGQWAQSFHPKATAVADVQVNAEGRYPD
jgi:hypothetical protein